MADDTPTPDAAPQQPSAYDLAPRIAEARKAGYSDDEIAAHLAASPAWGGKFRAAEAAGYKPAEVVGYLGKQMPPPGATIAPAPGTETPAWAGGASVPKQQVATPPTPPPTEEDMPAGAVPMHPQSYLGAQVNAPVQGAISSVGEAVHGIGTRAANAGPDQLAKAREVADAIDAGRKVPDADDAAGYAYMNPAQRKQFRAQLDQAASQPTPPPNFAQRWGEQMIQAAQQYAPVAKRNEGLGTEIGRNVGGFGALVAAGLAGGPGAAATMMWGQSYDGTYKQAIQAGADPAKADRAAMVNAGVQTAMIAVPLGRLMERVPTFLRGQVAETLTGLAKQGVEFGTFNAAATAVDNIVARNTYDPNRKLTDGIPDAAVTGMLTGALVPGAMALPHLSMAAGRAAIDAFRPDASDQFRAAMENVAARARQAAGVAASIDKAVGDREKAGAPDGVPIAETPPAAPSPTAAPPPAAAPAPGIAAAAPPHASVPEGTTPLEAMDLLDQGKATPPAPAGAGIAPAPAPAPEAGGIAGQPAGQPGPTGGIAPPPEAPGGKSESVSHLPEGPPPGFTTAKGSTYVLHDDGTTTRDKAFRPEHGEAEQGPQPRSEATFYVTPDQARALAEIQTTHPNARAIQPLGDGRFGVRYLDGPNAGKFEARTVVEASDRPAVGLTPVELWDGGRRVHFGNEITEVRGIEQPKPAAPRPERDPNDESWVRDAGDVHEALAKNPLPEGWELAPDPNSRTGYAVFDHNDQIVGRGETLPEALRAARQAAAERAKPEPAEPPKPEEPAPADQGQPEGQPGPTVPDQTAFAEEGRAIADEWVRLGNNGMAQAINARIRQSLAGKMPPLSEEGNRFWREQLAKEKAKREPGAPKPKETFDLDKFMSEEPVWKRHKEVEQPHDRAVQDEVQGVLQRITDAINAEGYTLAEASRGDTGTRAAEGKQRFGALAGAYSRWIKGLVAERKGYANAKPGRVQADAAEVVQELRKARAFLGEAEPEAPVKSEPANQGQPGPTAANSEAGPDYRAMFEAEAAELRRRLPSDYAKWRREGRLTEGQLRMVERLEALQAELKKMGPPEPKARPDQGQPGPTAANPEPEARPAGYGASNTLVSQSRAEEIRAKLREKLRGQLNAGLDPEILALGTELAVFHIEAGVRRFADLARAVAADLGTTVDKLRPFLRSWYNGARDMMEDHGLDVAGMDTPDTVREHLAKLGETQEAADAGTGPVDHPVGGDGDAEVPPGGDGAGQPAGDGHPADLEAGAAGNVGGAGEGGADQETGVRPGHEAVSGDDRVSEGGDAANGRAGTGDEGVAHPGAGEEERKPQPAPTRPNFHIDDPERLIGGTPKVRFARNRAAIEALRAIEAEQRAPTPEELEAMAGYTGWGSFGQELFNATWAAPRPKKGWEREDEWLRQHLGQEEWESARASIINAHYTDPPTVKAMWDMAERMGFRGGRILEPSMGIGNFFGMMPRPIMAASRLTGIELDRLTGAMAKLLYPEAGIHIKGYQDSKTPDNFYDLVIGNWPFAAQSPADRRYDKLSPTLHDYFFLKALDQTRPGGLVVGVTSAGTMDKAGRAARVEMAKKGELLAAFRLPSGAFEKYAGTSVVTDILVFRKREAPIANPEAEPWIDTQEVQRSGGTIRVNRYFLDHADAVLGRLDWGHGTTSGRPGMIVHRPEDLADRLTKLAERVPADGYRPVVRGKEPRFIANNTEERHGNVVIGPDGHLYQVQGERLARLADISKTLRSGSDRQQKAKEDQVKRLVGMRKAYGALIDAERDGRPETEDLRKALAEQFNAFRKAHGLLKDSPGLAILERAKDPSFPALAALERPDGTPSRILSEPTVRSRRQLETPTIADAYVLARNERATLDMDRIAELAGVTPEEAAKHLVETGAVYRTPGGGFEPADIYLGGNVRRKLREAEEALANGEDMQASVDALKKAIPPNVPYYQIEPKMGATWIGDQHYRDFIAELVGATGEDKDDINVRFAGGRWRVWFGNRNLNFRPEARQWGHADVPRFDKFVAAAMGNQTLTIKKKDHHGDTYVDEKATEEVNTKLQALREHFQDWAFKDAERKLDLENAYNEVMNAVARPTFDGSFMDMSGMALRRGDDPFALRKHQQNAIWRGVAQGRGLFAHEVGTGKTYTMGGIAVEGRRYGIFRKPRIFAHNANSAAVAHEISEMYPGAKLLFVDNLAPDVISTTLHRIANEDWDAIVMPHSLIDRMTLTEETRNDLARDEIMALEQEAMEAASEDGANLTPEMMDSDDWKKVRSPTAKELVKQRNAIIENIKKQANRASREGAVPFERLGVDGILVDEAHEFKKPPIATRMKLKGLAKQTSDRSIALGFLTGYVRKQNNDRGVYLFTGTPVTNALNEIFNMSRYFMPDRLEQAGIKDWDSWFNTFAAANNDLELTAAGTWEPVTKLAEFVNIDELVRLMSEYTDVVQAKDMPEFVLRTTPSGKTKQSPDLTAEEADYLENGRSENPIGRPYKRVITDAADPSPAQKEIQAELQQRAMEFKNATRMQRREMMLAGDKRVPIRVETDASNAGLDARLFDPDAPDHPDSKVNRVVRNVVKHYAEPNAAQVIFVDRGYSPNKAQEGREKPFTLTRELIGKRVAGGIPRDQIAVVAGGVTPERKKEVADMMNDGRLRVVIGQSGTLGVGVNMQVNLRAMHHMDAPWRPGDLEQRNGRGERQGNKWNTVLEYRYVTEGPDGRRWQVLSRKDRFIKQFINAFNDTSGKRLGNLEGEAADISEDQDILQTLSQAAGDPRIQLREKYKADVNRLERRERLHTVGQADAAKKARQIADQITEREASIAKDKAFAAQWHEGAARAEQAQQERGEKRRLYETAPGEFENGDQIQERMDAAVRTLARGDYKELATINGFMVSADWRPGMALRTMFGDEPRYLLLLPPDAKGHRYILDYMDRATMPTVLGAIRSFEGQIRSRESSLEQDRASIPRLEAAAKEPFPRQEKLNTARQNLAKIEEDLERNPVPPPSWLRHGAPVDTPIWVKGEERTVIGHQMDDEDYYVLTEQGRVPYLDATDENGQRVYDVHPPPQKRERPAGSTEPFSDEPHGAGPVAKGARVRLLAETGEPEATIAGDHYTLTPGGNRLVKVRRDDGTEHDYPVAFLEVIKGEEPEEEEGEGGEGGDQRPADFDVSRQTETPAFRRWFGDSKVTDAEGNPRVLYHGTIRWTGKPWGKKDGPDIEFGDVHQFDRHFARVNVGKNPSLDNIGTWLTTETGDPEEPRHGAGLYAAGEKGVVYPLFASIKNPKVYEPVMYRPNQGHMAFHFLMEDWNRWHEQRIASMPKGPEKDALVKRHQKNDFWGDPDGFQAYLKSQGYDGILLKDFQESANAPKQDAWIAFDPQQIKSAVGNRGTFDPENPDISYAKRPKAARGIPTAAPLGTKAVDDLRDAMRGAMREAGLPEAVGLRLVDTIAEGGADASYARGLITYALDTDPEKAPARLFHEIVHALRDFALTPAQRRALDAAASRWLADPKNAAARKEIEDQYAEEIRKNPAVLREEAIARLAEEALDRARARGVPPLVERATDAMQRFTRGLGQALRGRGYTTADHVFRDIMSGRVQGHDWQVNGGDADAMLARRRGARAPSPSVAPYEEPEGIRGLADNVQRVLAPTSRGAGAKMMEWTIRSARAREAQAWERAKNVLEDGARTLDRLPPKQQLDIWMRAETGTRQATPEVQHIMDLTRGALDDWTGKIQQLGRQIGRDRLPNAREFYMGRAYKNYDEWARGDYDAEGEARVPGGGKAPLRGSGNFLKKRSFETLEEARDAGLKPVTDNPVRMQLIKLREMQRFYHGTLLAESIKASGMARWIPEHEEHIAARSGWEALNDPLFQPKVRSEDDYGSRHLGGWYAPEPVAKVFNNYVSQGFHGKSQVYDTIREAGNLLNRAQLGASGFHATFVTLDTITSEVALGLKQLARGIGKGDVSEIGRGARTVGLGWTPYSAFRAVRDGSRLRQWYLGDPASLPPRARQLVQMLNAAGGRISMDGFYNAGMHGAFIKNLADLKRVFQNPGDLLREARATAEEVGLMRAPLTLVGRLMDNLMEPLMGYLVPRAKLGVFMHMAEDFMRANPTATPAERADALTKAWDSVENRLGQMTYDNVFWNKYVKDMAFISMRSVGWNLGTFRELGGAHVDAAKFALDAARFRKPEFTQRMAYALALPVTVAMYGALATWLMTGRGPQDRLDYFFPPDGKGGRVIIPSYIKDVIEFYRSPVQTAMNKTHPLASMASQLVNNRDYYGGIIYYKPADNPITAYGEYLLKQAVPFAVRAAMRQHAAGLDPTAQALAFFGIQPAPASIVAPEKGEKWQARQDRMAYRRREKNRAKGL